MAYAASIDNRSSLAGARYRLAGGVRVRAEKQGLLFYQRQGPRLYFLPSGTALSPDIFDFESVRFPDACLAFNGLKPSLRAALGEALSELVAKEVLVAD